MLVNEIQRVQRVQVAPYQESTPSFPRGFVTKSEVQRPARVSGLQDLVFLLYAQRIPHKSPCIRSTPLATAHNRGLLGSKKTNSQRVIKVPGEMFSYGTKAVSQ